MFIENQQQYTVTAAFHSVNETPVTDEPDNINT